MRFRRLAPLIVGVVLAASAVMPSVANASIAVTFPHTNITYVGTVPVGYSTTTTPSSISIVWTCTAGYCLQTVSSPITLHLVSTASSGSFVYSPSSSSVSFFSNWPGPMPDGTWSVQMKYTDVSSMTYTSSTVAGVQVSTETVPPTFTGPPANTTTNLSAIPIAYSLLSTPSFSVDPTLTFTNASTSASSVLTLSRTVTNGSFSLNPANLSAGPPVLSVAGANSLTDGAYAVTLSYADDEGHPAASITHSDWTLDRTTLTPTLSAPAGSGNETGPFDVTFDLPEAALSGSVDLVFTGGPTPITLALADTSAGAHTVVVDPDAPASGADVLSSSAGTLPAGDYTLVVAYQDALGNAVSSSGPTPLTIAAPVTSTTSTSANTTTSATGPSGDTGPTGIATTTTTLPPAALPAATGRLAGRRLGRLVLGMRRSAVHGALPDAVVTHDRFDRFRLAGGAIRVGYPSARLMHTLAPRRRAAVRGRAILILTAVPYYRTGGLTPGAPLTAARSLIAHAARFRVGINTWYAIRQARRTVILKVAHDTVCEIGIAERGLTRTRREERRLLTSFTVS